MNDIIEEQVKLYRASFLEHGDSPEGTYQNDFETKHLRFSKLIEKWVGLGLDDKAISIHDVGCGTADFYEYLLSRGHQSWVYSGTDVVQEMIDHATRKFPNSDFYCRDILKEDVHEKYDVLTFSGVLNLPGKIERSAWSQFSFALVSRMFEICRMGISFNFLTNRCDYFAEELHYIAPEDVFDFCNKQLSRFVSIDAGYPLFEVTVTVFKEDFLSDRYSHPAFIKYFKNKSEAD